MLSVSVNISTDFELFLRLRKHIQKLSVCGNISISKNLKSTPLLFLFISYYYALAEAVNGEVFFDNYGEFSNIREQLIRCMKHGEPESAQLACVEFVNAAMRTIFLLQDRELTDAICGDLEKHAYSVNDRIADSTIRNMNILIAV